MAKKESTLNATGQLTYSDAGVDIDVGDDLVERIKPDIATTKRAGSLGNIGGFAGVFDPKAAGFHDPILLAATDGVGTKLALAQAISDYSGLGYDLVAMCVNDLVVQGAEPLFFLDYYACGKLDVNAAETVIRSIAQACKQSGCALIGGETAEMPGLYQNNDFDLAGFTVGAIERKDFENKSEPAVGDIAIGLPSSGVHSNGFSLVRKIVEISDTSYHSPAPYAKNMTLGQSLITPTRIYVQTVLEAFKAGYISGAAHITGGGLMNNPQRALRANTKILLDLSSYRLPPVFAWLQKTGNVAQTEMLRTFNCGIGMILFTPPEQLDDLCRSLKKSGEEFHHLGSVAESNETEPHVEFINHENYGF